jgi:hypothetical protein
MIPAKPTPQPSIFKIKIVLEENFVGPVSSFLSFAK